LWLVFQHGVTAKPLVPCPVAFCAAIIEHHRRQKHMNSAFSS
jgi:hypothetical protein